MDPVNATTLATAVAAKGFQGLLASLFEKYIFRKGSSALGENRDIVRTDLRDHLHFVFDKCIMTKTILNDSPINLLSIYVDQRFKRRDAFFDQYELIEDIRTNGSSVIITGIGGGGKSFFMRYLWISFFENSAGKIPLFIEIRQINTSKSVNIRDFLFHTVIRTGSTISQTNFDQSIKNGEIVIFIDGFDEIIPEKRRDAEIQIQQLRENNPNLVIVMTSRPDDRFGGWHQFEKVEVLPMSKEESEILIGRAIYDDLSKSRLLKRIKDGLYESHSSFLSNPLLAYMMLLTIARNPDIPNKMSAFYELAFDALYHRHDTMKGGGFVRKYSANLDKQQFIRLLSYFCLSTYVDGVTEASEDKILSYIEMSKEFEAVTERASDFLGDIVDNVCLMKKDGIYFNFIHRSFQEYFAAVCICRVASRDIEELFTNFAERYNDEVLPMVAEMDPDLFREKYLIPMRGRFEGYFTMPQSDVGPIALMGYSGQMFVGRSAGPARGRTRNSRHSEARSRNAELRPSEFLVTLEGGNAFNQFVSSLQNVSGFGRLDQEQDVQSARLRRGGIDEKFFIEAGRRFDVPADAAIQLLSDGENLLLRTVDGSQEFRDPWIEEEFKGTYMFKYMSFFARRSYGYVNEEVGRYSRVSASFRSMMERAKSRGLVVVLNESSGD
ncbi:NACHT domain-containing protein [Roseovarius sp.]|uniref:NACHT domain-containing protein n=1 Tax=Roseovarius sp. TaxID=1486281 RepID=UPI003A975A95